MAARPGRRIGWLSLAALLLAGCAVGGPLPVLDGQASLPEPRLDAADGSALALSEWAPDRPRAVMLAVHGYGDYGPSTFAGAARFWAARGIQTYAYDQRGFGRNRSFGRWPGAEALVDDLTRAAGEIRARHPCLPLIVTGHSMGGGVALAAAGRGLDADGLVLAAPAIWGGGEMNPFHRLVAWGAAAVVPEHRFTGEGIVRIQASDNIEMLRALARDPNYLRPPSAREIFGLVRLSDMAAEAAAIAGMPSLLLLGTKDEIVPNRRVRRVYDRMGGPRNVIEYPQGWHLLFRDLQAERVWRDVADWALAQAGPGCG
ncbi:MAG: lysophospholipase [Paracoccaceae bacterium]|nr:lysophospholipase [Paracoccaceae bacterium]